MKPGKQIALFALVTLAAVIAGHGVARSHCEIPCGSYGDETLIAILFEHTATVEKSMIKISELAKGHNPNQLVRWISNKEEHANTIQHIVTQYFMTQRIKPDNKNYVKQLTTLHGLMIHAMKAKQTTDLAHIGHLRNLVGELSGAYFSAADLKHIKEHHPDGK